MSRQPRPVPGVPRRPSRRRGLTASRSIGLLLVLGPLIACQRQDERAAGSRPARAAPAVEALAARSGTLPLEERLSGLAKAHNQVGIRPEISSLIAEVFVRSGEAVESGQPLLRLSGSSLDDQLLQAEANARLEEASVREARARVAELEAQTKRSRQLAKQSLISRQELETQEAQLSAARAQADQAAARLEQSRAAVGERRTGSDKTLIRSPISGRLGQLKAEVGQLVDPGTVIVVVGQLEKLVVEVPLTEAMLAYVREGHPVRIGSAALGGETLDAKLSRISPFLAAGSFSTVGEIDVDNSDGRLMPGMFVTVDVLYGQSVTATLVPSSALWEDPRTGERGVFVIPSMNGQPEAVDAEPAPEPRGVEFRPVEVLAQGRATSGLRGVEPGEWVVVVGQQLLGRDPDATARVRRMGWDRMLGLQSRQREDVVRDFLDKQQQLARTQGVEPPPTSVFLKGPPRSGASP